MTPKKQPQNNRKRAKISIEMKLKIIEKKQQGVSVADLSRMFNRSTSTICTVLKNKDKILEFDASMGVTRISPQRPRVLDDVERLLLIWITEKQLQGDSVTKNLICEKARTIFADLVEETPSATEEEVFKASTGWFENFKKRTGIHNVVWHGEAESSGTKATDSKVKNLVDTKGYLPQQFSICDDNGIFLKKIPKRTYVTAEEKVLPGDRPMKDPLDCGDLVNEHNQELNMEDYLEVQQENENKTLPEEQQSSGEIIEILKAWETVESYILKHHPNKAVAKQATYLFNDNALLHFRQILKHRKNQQKTTLDSKKN